jgi:ABC-type Fe3+-hydroxamate transport system substrate-binding protein
MIHTTDQCFREVKLRSITKKIISVVPSQTELLFDLGLQEEVIGITKFCIHPNEWFRSKLRVGGTKNLNLEKIRQLQPDLIIANKEENDQNQIKMLMEEFPVWISDIKNLNDALEMISEVSKITDKTEAGKSIIQKIKIEFTTFEKSNSGKISCAYLIWENPLMTVGRDTFISDMMNRCGLLNIFSDQMRYPEINIDDLRTKNPQVILLSSEPYPFKEKHIENFRNMFPGSVILAADGEMFSWYGSRLLKTPAYFTELSEKIKTAL